MGISFYSCFVHSRLERVCLKFLPNLKMHRGWLTVITIALTLLVVGPTQARGWNIHHYSKKSMTSGMVTNAVEGAKQSILYYPDRKADMAKHLRDRFTNKYGGDWSCIVSEDWYTNTWYITNIRYIEFRVNGIRFLLFQTDT